MRSTRPAELFDRQRLVTWIQQDRINVRRHLDRFVDRFRPGDVYNLDQRDTRQRFTQILVTSVRQSITDLDRVGSEPSLLIDDGSRILQAREQKGADSRRNRRGNFSDQIFRYRTWTTRHRWHEPDRRRARVDRHPRFLDARHTADLYSWSHRLITGNSIIDSSWLFRCIAITGVPSAGMRIKYLCRDPQSQPEAGVLS